MIEESDIPLVEVEHGLSEEELDAVEAVATAEGLSVDEFIRRASAELASEYRDAQKIRRYEIARARLQFGRFPRRCIWGLFLLLKCPHVQCTGVHDGRKPYRTWCPAIKERKRGRDLKRCHSLDYAQRLQWQWRAYLSRIKGRIAAGPAKFAALKEELEEKLRATF